MRRSSFIGWLAVAGVIVQERMLAPAVAATTRSNTAPGSNRDAVASIASGGRCHASRATSRWSGYTRADLG
ncbi:MAG TPA: hypothetical protein VGX02_06350 [Candidatus Eremiobacteraceae bacterium]|jgi:hypothetical protein|nr:hypothetical protein [Candidatus Eremiobacteraceae bacterium]